MTGEPQAGNRQRDRGARAGRREFGEETAVERPLARAEVAGDEDARPHAPRQAGILQKAAMGDAGRLGRGRDRPAHAGRGEVVLARLAAGPAGRALEPGREPLGVGEKRKIFAARRHGPDRERRGCRQALCRLAASADSRRPQRSRLTPPVAAGTRNRRRAPALRDRQTPPARRKSEDRKARRMTQARAVIAELRRDGQWLLSIPHPAFPASRRTGTPDRDQGTAASSRNTPKMTRCTAPWRIVARPVARVSELTNRVSSRIAVPSASRPSVSSRPR